jgi:hypothetical protein
MKSTILKFTLIVCIYALTISCTSKEKRYNKDKNKVSNSTDKITGKTVIEELEVADFFKITDKSRLSEVKNYMISSFEKNQYFGGLTYEDSIIFIDHRFYFIDQEELFEIGGLVKYLNEIKRTFNLLNLKLEISNEDNHEETFSNNFWEHTVELNKKKYTAFKGDMDENSWGIAMLNFAKMINNELSFQKSKEQVYLIYEGNGGMLVFLTPEIFEIVKKYYPDDSNRPMIIEAWKKYYKIN